MTSTLRECAVHGIKCLDGKTIPECGPACPGRHWGEKPSEISDDGEMAAGALDAIHALLDDGGIPRGTFADDHVRNLVVLYNQRGARIEELEKAMEPVATGEMLDVTCDHSECPHWGLIKFPAMEPVSLWECEKAVANTPRNCGSSYNVIHRRIAKAVLDAAGVKYVE